MFDIGQGTQDLGFRSERDFLFHCAPAREVVFKVLDENGHATTGMFLIRDGQGRIYPSQAKRLAPDFAFHPQIYLERSGKVKTARGSIRSRVWAGPEYLVEKRPFEIAGTKQTLEFKLKRWIDPSKSGWRSGDHHIHAAGCAH